MFIAKIDQDIYSNWEVFRAWSTDYNDNSSLSEYLIERIPNLISVSNVHHRNKTSFRYFEFKSELDFNLWILRS